MGLLQSLMPALWGLLRDAKLRSRIVAAVCSENTPMPPPLTQEEEYEMAADELDAVEARGVATAAVAATTVALAAERAAAKKARRSR